MRWCAVSGAGWAQRLSSRGCGGGEGLAAEGARVSESLRPAEAVREHVEEDLPHVARRVDVAVPQLAALGAPAHAVDLAARAGLVRVAAPASVEPVVGWLFREGAIAAALGGVVFVDDDHTRVELEGRRSSLSGAG